MATGDGAADTADAQPKSDAASDATIDGADDVATGDARPTRGVDGATVPPGQEVAAPKPGVAASPTTDKDIAREAWRHNVPDVRVEDAARR